MKKWLLYTICFLYLETSIAQNTARQQMELASDGWRFWLDQSAEWQNDTLYLPHQFKVEKATSHPPTCGWDSLLLNKGVVAALPASFEQIFGKGDPNFRYHGVGWCSKIITIPEAWAGKRIFLEVEKARQRVEVYINGKLCGYDLVAETPFSIDVSKYITVGGNNSLAFRITNPGGQRGWDDNPCIAWGKNYLLPPGHDFGGIGGAVTLKAVNATNISQVFIKNILPANGRNILIQALVNQEVAKEVPSHVRVAIVPYKGSNEPIFSARFPFSHSSDNKNALWQQQVQVPNAALWSVDSPHLYYCHLTLEHNGQIVDEVKERFGFRTFEAKFNTQGQLNYYLNGQRIRLKSAIDWGYYAQTGFFATNDMALKSVQNAKAIGHNCISFHRRIGEPLVMQYADELGLLIYEEPGGMPGIDGLHISSWLQPADKAYVAVETMLEKCKRMVLRDRNHPSVVVWSLSNEQNAYDVVHKKLFTLMNGLDDSRMLVNQSGGQLGGASGFVPNIRPYQSMPNLQYIDDHTVDSKSRFQEGDLFTHHTQNDSCIVHWGEVRCYTGPANWVQLANMSKRGDGYDDASWQPMANKINQYFAQNNFSKQPHIRSAADLPTQAGRGLMYTNGRLGQATLINNSTDGYAINGWSETNQSLHNDFLAWYSAICDEGRHLKGPASDFAYWTRPLQIAILRKNGKYFSVNNSAQFAIHLLNEGQLPAGNYELQIRVKDGNGQFTAFQQLQGVVVKGGDVYAQLLFDACQIKMDTSWRAGYITIVCNLLKDKKVVASGTEQILLRNRASYKTQFDAFEKNNKPTLMVHGWPAAAAALKDAGINVQELALADLLKCRLLATAAVPSADTLKSILKAVSNGAQWLIKFDSLWASVLYQHHILKQPVTEWGGVQTGFWNGNGWGYLDTYVGELSIPSKQVVGTNSWEVDADPVGFYPFVSAYPQSVHGTYFARPSQLLTLLGSIQYGKGTIVILPGYDVGAQNAFNDLLFYEIIKKHIK